MDNLIEKIKEYVMEECRKYKEWTDGKPGWRKRNEKTDYSVKTERRRYHKKKRPIFLFSRQIQAEKVVKDIR